MYKTVLQRYQRYSLFHSGMWSIRGFVFVRTANLQHDLLGFVPIPRRAAYEIQCA